MAEQQNVSGTPSEGGYERTDIHPATPAWLAVGVLVITVAALVLMSWLFDVLESASERRARASSPLRHSTAIDDASAMPPSPEEQLELLRDYERTSLETYGWVDRPGGIARIPIERAMELTVERATPGRGTGGSR